MSAYRHAPSPPQQDPVEHSYADRVPAILCTLVALLPFVQLLISGSADQLDLGVAAVLLIFALSSLTVGRASPIR